METPPSNMHDQGSGDSERELFASRICVVARLLVDNNIFLKEVRVDKDRQVIKD